MSEALILAFLFFMGCIIGWGIEVIFRRFKKENVSRKWVKSGLSGRSLSASVRLWIVRIVSAGKY